MPAKIHVYVMSEDEAEQEVDDALLGLAKISQNEFIDSVLRTFDSIGKSATQNARLACERDPNGEDVRHFLRLACKCITLSSVVRAAFTGDDPMPMNPNDVEIANIAKLLLNEAKTEH